MATMKSELASKPQPLALAFRNISYTVALKGRAAKKGATAKTILKGISGVCQPGRVMAIMGPSGAGKTTLLDVLAGRVRAHGELALGPKSRATPRDIAQRAAYVQQDDAIMASQTVREALQMAADLTLPRGTTSKERVALCEQLIATFHLTGAADTIVGDPVGRLKGISGGERKRLAVAMGAVREPQLIFLDEPTSGLDAHKAYVLINTLKGFANDKASTVVCTIHQPSSDLFALFDDLLLLLVNSCVALAFETSRSEVHTRLGSVLRHPTQIVARTACAYARPQRPVCSKESVAFTPSSSHMV